MSRKSSCIRIRSERVTLPLALLLLLLSAITLASGALEANEYGEIVEASEATGPETSEDAAGIPAESGESGAGDGGATEAADASDSIDGADNSGMDASEKTDPTEAKESADVDGSDEDEADGGESADVEGPDEDEADGGEPTTAEAVVYVINNDDDTLSISLYIDSELVGTEEISKDKEKKFGDYQLEAGSHEFEISWWDDDTKKTHREELTETVEEETAVTLYATQHKEPEEHEINVMLRNENDEDLEAYLYIDGEYEKLKTAKKESTTDFGKFDIEEGTHELAVRWQDPETNIEYEKRKTIRVDGTDAVTFYAPAGMSFESDEVAAPATKSSRATKSDDESASTASSSETSSSAKEEGEEDTASKTEKDTASETEKIDSQRGSSNSNEVGAAADGMGTTAEETVRSGDGREDDGGGDESSDAGGAALYISTIGAILAIYIIFFRR